MSQVGGYMQSLDTGEGATGDPSGMLQVRGLQVSQLGGYRSSRCLRWEATGSVRIQMRGLKVSQVEGYR